METVSKETRKEDYITVADGAKYASVSIRTFRKWLQDGLRHVRISKKTIRTRRQWIDDYLLEFQEDKRTLERIVEEVMQDFAAAS